MGMIKKKDLDYLKYKYPIEKVLKNPSILNKVASVWQVVILSDILETLKIIEKKLPKEDST